MQRLFAVTTAHGPAWDAAWPVERQAAWKAHADFMNALEAEGFVLLGGTLDAAQGAVAGAAGALLVVRARDAEEVRWRLAADPWAKGRLLRVESIRAWTLRLGEDFEALWVPARARAEAANTSPGRAKSPNRPRAAGRPRNAGKSPDRGAAKARKSPDRSARNDEKSR